MGTGNWIDKRIKDVEIIINKLKQHKAISYVILIAVIIIGIGTFTDSVDKIAQFTQKYLLSQSVNIKQDDKHIYQHGEIVGNVTGNVNIQNDIAQFGELTETGKLNRNAPFYYLGNSYAIKSIEKFTGVQIISDSQSATLKKEVLKNVVCQKL
jgi:hypothetical protein